MSWVENSNFNQKYIEDSIDFSKVGLITLIDLENALISCGFQCDFRSLQTFVKRIPQTKEGKIEYRKIFKEMSLKQYI